MNKRVIAIRILITIFFFAFGISMLGLFGLGSLFKFSTTPRLSEFRNFGIIFLGASLYWLIQTLFMIRQLRKLRKVFNKKN